MSEEITEEQGFYPAAAHEKIPSGKKYGSFLDFMNHQPKRAPEPPLKPRPGLGEYYSRMVEARDRYKKATANEEAMRQQALLCQEELSKLETQQRVLEEQKANALQSGDKTKMVALSQDIEIIQYQITQRSTELDALLIGEDCKTILQEARKTEQQFYGTVLEGYKNEITNGKCKIPFSELIAKAYALACQCGTGDVVTYLFQWTSVPSLVGEDIERLLKGIEAEYEK